MFVLIYYINIIYRYKHFIYLKTKFLYHLIISIMLTKEQVNELLIRQNLEGFTVAVKGELKRYTVANTHNKFEFFTDLVNKLIGQANENMYAFDNVTIGGWIDSKTNKIYIDAGMSTDDLTYAINTGKYTKQIAIWDNIEQKEIRLEY